MLATFVYLHSDLNKSRARDRYLVVAIAPPFCDIKKFIGSQLRSSSYHVKQSECFKVPSDLADPIRAPPALYRHESDDEDDPGTTPHLPPSLPDIPDAISASVHPPSVDPHCLISPLLDFSTAPTVDDAATQSPCPDAVPLEQAVTSADLAPPSLRRSSRIRRPPCFLDYDTEL